VAFDDAMKQGVANRQSPLTSRGVKQRDITAEYLFKNFGSFDAVFASTYERTREIPRALGVTSQIHSHLDERSMGVWHIHPRDVLAEQIPEELERLLALGSQPHDYYHYKAPEGESCPDVEQRLHQFLDDQKTFRGIDTLLISGHGIAGLCLRKALLGGTVEDWHSWDRLKNASVTVYERRDDAFECVLYNHVPWDGLIDDGEGKEA
jgi:broad specificity phosphatase PhoE